MTDKPDVSLAEESAVCADLYRSMQLEGVVSWKAFRQAVTGYHKIADRKRDVLTLIDFSRPSTEKRLFVFDMKQRRLLFSSVVSHGKNSGDKYATSAEADTINKLSAAIAKMEGDYGIADIISVSKQILFWLRKRDPQKAIELSYYFDEFVKEKLR